MIRPTPCRRCNGNVIPERDEWGQAEHVCMACGAREYPGQRAPLTIEEERALLRRFSTGKDGGRNFRDAQVGTPAKLRRIAAQMRLMEA